MSIRRDDLLPRDAPAGREDGRAAAGDPDPAAAHEQAGLAAVPDYPTGALPPVARGLVKHGETVGLPAALVGGAALAAAAATLGNGAALEVMPGWEERAILWVPLLAPRGAGKSPAQRLALSPLRDHDRQNAEREAAGDEDTPRDLLTGDATVEALARQLHAAGGAVGVDVDELAQLLRGVGEYKRGGGGDQGRLLSLWTGDPWKFTRVGDGKRAENAVNLRIARPTVVIVGGLQPALHELLGGDEDGLRPRWLPHLAEMPRGRPQLAANGAPVDWQLLLGHKLLPARGTARRWHLGGTGRERFTAHRERWKRQAHRGLEASTVAGALVKADVHLARVALVLAEMQNPGRGGDVDGDTVDRAAAIVDFTVECWRALPEQEALVLSRRDATLDRGVARLVAWLEQHEDRRATRRDLQRARVAGVRTPADLDALLGRYEAMHPGCVQEAAQEHGRGLPVVVVRAPTRTPSRTFSPLVSPSGDTKGGAAENPRGHGGIRWCHHW